MAQRASSQVLSRRGALGVAIRDLNEEAAVEAVRELIRAKKQDQIRHARDLLTESGYTVTS